MVANLALIGQDAVDRLVARVPGLLAPGGTFVVQTLHPVSASGEAPYRDGWRVGSWSGFSSDFTDPAPWYFRTLGTWVALFDRSGLALRELREPLHPGTHRPASVVFMCSEAVVLKRAADTSVLVATIPFTITAGQDAMIYATGGEGSSAVTTLVTTDDNAVPPSTSARVRLVHLAVPAGPIDVFVTASGADLAAATPAFAGAPLRSASPYVTLPAGSYLVRAVPAGTAPAQRAGAVVFTSAPLDLVGGSVRTIVAADNGSGGTPPRAIALADP